MKDHQSSKAISDHIGINDLHSCFWRHLTEVLSLKDLLLCCTILAISGPVDGIVRVRSMAGWAFAKPPKRLSTSDIG